jgi:hypothetical protein
MVRFAFGLPLAVATILINLDPSKRVATPNDQLIATVGSIDWGRADIAWVGEIFPPISTLTAAITPGGTLGLGLVGAAAAGIFLQRVLEIMVQRKFPPSTTVILLYALAGNPLFFFTATENLAGFLGLMFFGLAVADILRFVSWGNTHAGFRAGVFFMLGALSDIGGLLYIVTAAATMPFLRHSRSGQAGVRRANVLVVVFPTLSALGGIMMLNWIFLGSPFGRFVGWFMDGAPGRADDVASMFSTTSGLLMLTPVLSAWLIAIIVRRPGAIVVSTLIFAAYLVSYVAGFVLPGTAGNLFIMMTLIAIALIPTARSVTTNVLLDMIAVLQFIIAWVAALSTPIVVDWLRVLSDAVR